MSHRRDNSSPDSSGWSLRGVRPPAQTVIHTVICRAPISEEIFPMNRVLTCMLAAVVLAGGELAAQSTPGGSLANQASFGRAVGIVANDVLVGEPSNETKSGLVYVYRKAAARWAEASAISA